MRKPFPKIKPPECADVATARQVSLRLLHRAALGMEIEVEAALALLLDAGEIPTPERVKALLGDMEPTQAPEMAAPEVDLHEYDALMGAGLQEAI